VLGLEPPAFGRGEPLGGDLERGQIEQGLPDAAETFFEPDAERAEGGARWVGAHAEVWLSEQPGALARCGTAEARDQGQSLLGAEVLSLGGALERLLLFVGQATKRVGDRGSDLAAVELALERGEKTPPQHEPSRDPARPAANPPRHGLLALVVLRDERVDHAGLVHGGATARRRVGAQEQQLAVDRGKRLLDDDGDLAMAGRHPVREPLEAVQDLEGAVLPWGDP
jgi:hypothetical protein